ncbi:hypothetical protein, conserved [Plasmodium gonderi]|uniref:PI31 proteasome regulator N-terminal domain-containing protein n=1 Tax=Plasmodium gonderi TaxID=77519 RepID=A0A1Y1JKF8_PLAGO|nr:hypothetical protein, conserved [Plasmodium gonderi]GAW80524.1 hypothetical protein, conserved [Plasmodium gonderi]
MSKHNTFKNLVKLNGMLKKEEILVLFFHSCILDNNFIYKLNDEKNIKVLENKEKIQVSSDGYIKHMIDSDNEKFFVSRILIEPDWRNNSNNYNFMYKSAEKNYTYNLNILKIENSLVLQIIDTAQPSIVHSVTIDMDKYINNCSAEKNITDNIEESIQIEKLEKIFQTHILSNMKNGNDNNNDNNRKGLKGITVEPNANEYSKNIFRADKDLYLLQNFNDDYFDDKNPSIGRNLIPDLRNNIPVLKPDGLLVGPDNKFFNQKNLRYDPIGPFGNEPNSDNKPFEFQNNFPF